MTVPMDQDTVSLSLIVQIIEAVAVVAGGGIALIKFGRGTARVETAIALQAQTVKIQLSGQSEEIRELKNETRKIAELVTNMAVATTRADAHERHLALLDARYDELRHGEGFVFPLGAHLKRGLDTP